jgi:two-component system, cell cycle response regulator
VTRLLLIDDDTFFLQVYSDFLRGEGYEVDTAVHADQALKLYKPGYYRLLILDLTLPGTPAIELIDRIRQRSPAQDIVVVGGPQDVHTALKTMKLGVYDYLTKPVERDELRMLIDRLQERATLYDEHARLLQENLEHVELRQIMQRSLRVMDSLDLEVVCENLLSGLSEITSAQGAALWLDAAGHDEVHYRLHGYRGLVDATTVPWVWVPRTGSMVARLSVGVPLLVRERLDDIVLQTAPAEALLCPLSRGDRLVGFALLVKRLGDGFGAREVERAKTMTDAAAVAVDHARRFGEMQRVGLRDPVTSAYNMSYFVDHLGREIHKARRYQRSFALIQVTIDNLLPLKQQLPEEVLRETLRRIILSLSSVLRDIDVLARVGEDELFMLLSETDFLGGIYAIQRAREAIAKQPFLADIDRQHAIAMSYGPAAFPRDGDDVDQLFVACRRRLDEARRSSFRRLQLEDLAFWDAVDLLVDSASGGNAPAMSRWLKDERGISRQFRWSEEAMRSVRAAILEEVRRQAKASGWFYVGSAWQDESFVERLHDTREGGVQVYALGERLPLQLADWGIASVRVGSDVFQRCEVMLMLAEHAAYGLLARRDGDAVTGFHTADWTLVQGLIDKLQDTYHLQKGGP